MIRNILCSILMLGSSCVVVLAQDSTSAPSPAPSSTESSGGNSFGFKLMYGVGMIGVSDPQNMTFDVDGAYSAGIFWNWSTSGLISFAVQPELLLVGEASNMTVGGGTATPPNEITTTSLRLPILLKLQFLDRHIIQPSVYVGPYLGYLLSATSKIGDAEASDIENTEAFQYGLTVGVDATFLRIFQVDIRYYFGFSDVASFAASGQAEDVAWKMNSLQFGIGLRF